MPTLLALLLLAAPPRTAAPATPAGVAVCAAAPPRGKVAPEPAADTLDHHARGHRMASFHLGGWRVAGMAQAVPVWHGAAAPDGGDGVDGGGLFLTQPLAMVGVESPGRLVVLRVTPNLEAWTHPDGVPTYGLWGEGFLDARHPHTVLHEAMVSLNRFGDAASFSLSAGKGFVPYGTADPMGRPALQYPTNHHLSQIVERLTVNGVAVAGGWSVEAALFGGREPAGPHDFSNLRGLGDSWAARVTRRQGAPLPDGGAAWEMSASVARVRDFHGQNDVVPLPGDIPCVPGQTSNTLANVAVRHEAGGVYALAEASRSWGEGFHGGLFSVLGEARVRRGDHAPYARLEWARRPEYARRGGAGSDEFYRYDPRAVAIGTTRWIIATAGWAWRAGAGPALIRPFLEGRWWTVAEDRGFIDPDALYGAGSAWGLSVGVRLSLGGGPMRMGTYGVLDPMTVSSSPTSTRDLACDLRPDMDPSAS